VPAADQIVRSDPDIPYGGAGDGTIIIISRDKVKSRDFGRGIS
jgi:hypothetical protein